MPSSRAASIRSGVDGTSTTSSAPKPTKSGFFSRLTGSTLSVPSTPQIPIGAADGSVDEFILSGTAFGEDNPHLPRSFNADVEVQVMGKLHPTYCKRDTVRILSAVHVRLFNLVFSLLPAKIRSARVPTH